MKSTGHIDWISVTLPYETPGSKWVPGSLWAYGFELTGQGLHGYGKRWTNKLGVTIMSEGTIAQGVHVILSGQTLEKIRALGVSDRDLAEHYATLYGKFSRCDLALNLHDAAVKVSDLVAEYERGDLKTPARSGTHYRGIGRAGETLYLGNRSSERMLRIYDKAAEQGQDDKPWVRIELETKRMRARAIHSALVQHQTRAVVNDAIKDMMQTENDEIKAALAGDDIDMPKPAEKLSDTYKWLMDVCAPAMARYQMEHIDQDVLDQFITVYENELKYRMAGKKE